MPLDHSWLPTSFISHEDTSRNPARPGGGRLQHGGVLHKTFPNFPQMIDGKLQISRAALLYKLYSA